MILGYFLNAQEITGDWNGILEVQGTKLRLVIHIHKEGGKLSATMDSPDQGANGLPVQSIEFEASTLTIKMPNLGMEYTATLNQEGTEFKGMFKQSGLSLPLNLNRKKLAAPLVNRPQHPTAPFPYHAEEVTFKNASANITLAGTLTLPQKAGVFPVVILISGSGPQNRDEELFKHKPFLVIADHLTKKGIGVLRFDDRGVGQSEGDFNSATSKDFASDVQAGIEYLKTRKEIKKDQIGLVGHSEGGLIAPMVAVDNSDVAFIVMMAGPGVSGEEILVLQQELINRAGGLSKQKIAFHTKITQKVFELLKQYKDSKKIKEEIDNFYKKELSSLTEDEKKEFDGAAPFAITQLDRLTSPWFRFFLSHQPKDALEKVKCPVLAINGAKDLQVDVEQNFPAIEKALKKAGNTDFTMKKLSNLNHLFQTTETGSPSEYGQLEETFSPKALEEISSWILLKVKN